MGRADAVDVGQQDFVEKDGTEASGQQQVAGADRAGQDARHGAAVDPQAIEHHQQRRQQDRDEGDVHRHQILRHQRGDDEQTEQRPLYALAGTLLVAAKARRDSIGQQFEQARARQRHGEGADHHVGQADLGADQQVVVEGADGVIHRQSGVQRAEHGGADQGDGHGDTQQAQHNHAEDRQHRRVDVVADGQS